MHHAIQKTTISVIPQILSFYLFHFFSVKRLMFFLCLVSTLIFSFFSSDCFSHHLGSLLSRCHSIFFFTCLNHLNFSIHYSYYKVYRGLHKCRAQLLYVSFTLEVSYFRVFRSVTLVRKQISLTLTDSDQLVSSRLLLVILVIVNIIITSTDVYSTCIKYIAGQRIDMNSVGMCQYIQCVLHDLASSSTVLSCPERSV